MPTLEAEVETVHGRLNTVEEVARFLSGGKATFTLVSRATGVRFTFKVRRKETVTFVSLLNGPDNWTNYAYIGMLNLDGNGLRLTAKSNATEDAPSVRAFRYFAQNLAKGVLPDTLEFWHTGHCCRCNRLLTVPSSVASGIGPECASKF